MPRRSKPKAQQRDLRWWLSMLLNGAVALSMVLGTVFLFTGAPRPTPPTIEAPTAAPTSPALTPAPLPTSPPVAPTPTLAPPSPIPKASASAYSIAVAGRIAPGTAMLFIANCCGAFQAMAFLDQDLAATQSPVKMAFMQHPPFDPAGGSHTPENGSAAFTQVVAARGVRYVFAEHIHCYEEGERD